MYLDQDFEQLSTERPTTSGRDPEQVLHEVFGYESFRPLQGDIIREVSEGRDALVLMPTGGGKSLCYQVPALVRSGTAIVISPLIALMQDQVAALKELGVRAAFLNSTMDFEQARATEYALMTGELDLLYCAPERLIQPRTIELLHDASISLFAIDEAHCVSQWGHDFRSDYLQLSMLAEQFPGVPRIALTATADERTRKEIAERLSLTEARHFVSGFDRPNIQYRIAPKINANKQLLDFIKAEHEGDCGIVYCLSRNKVDATAKTLAQKGYTALPYHAGLSSEQRAHHQERFLREDGVIIVATIAFGMGIDKPDVRFVAHLDLPKSLEAYYQETGRAGRDGKPSTAWMVYGLQDVIKLRQMLESSQGNDHFKRVERQKLDAMLGLCEVTSCRRQVLLRYFGDELEQPCGNCDTCLNPPDTWDGTVAVQKALSCVFRTGQRFGVTYLIDVLRGSENERILQSGHHQVSTYGIGTELSANEWKSVYRQLVANGYLRADPEGYGALQLTEQCRPLLKGRQTIELRKDPEIKKTTGRANGGRSGSPVSEQITDKAGWEALRACRKELADKQGVPPYVIFHDTTLFGMLERKPRTLDELAEVSGVGAAKLEKYGEIFLQTIAGLEQA
ncbi:DNA helicase RecQ [Marinobacter adhaerens]|jgi:ATP-dependent DNA helicase RecQ|uniref:DNA helicase RecQ n=4 Tax=Marinobacter TaxID=2742 RepID=A0A352IR83_9GAMM|nr:MULTISPECIES: DNA helicase RecQ [Marinobacter]MBI47069.1 DNA helicase RecQ [Marinobacter sp.]ADP97482.1 ATP-dependent DNA helicase RecQ [Marinobacter adhaerens HP15]MBW4978568.1 DNA helicase RecQ [Marinobacter adhaerens]PPI78702.1 DNA helicase RecQ [Marinobacter flavimaris]QWV11559.1 DNA helicase RecQ [Marinobacter adhaerens]|tara:strand:- start:1280 stop:3148 length:1869 start_codon:yes stop_codon:yes gene_type:complete